MHVVAAASSREAEQEKAVVARLSVRQLRTRRRQLAASFALMPPQSPARAVTAAQMTVVDAELDTRRQFRLEYPANPSNVPVARHRLERLLAGCPVSDSAVLIASELVTNSILHSNSSRSGGTFTLAVECYTEYLWIEVTDIGGPWGQQADDDRDGTHGLDIVAALAGSWAIEDIPAGRVVWARLRLP